MIKFDTSSAWRWILDDANNTQVWHIARSSLENSEHTFPIYSNICLFSARRLYIWEWITDRRLMVFDFHTPRDWRGNDDNFCALTTCLTLTRRPLDERIRMPSRVKIDWYGSYNGHGVFVWDARLTHFSFYLRRHGAFIEIERHVSPLSQYLQHTFRVQKINGQTHNCLYTSDAEKLWEKANVSFIDAKEITKEQREIYAEINKLKIILMSVLFVSKLACVY
jgi:hypothetical protein